MIPPPTVLATLPTAGKSQDCQFRTSAVQSLALSAVNQDVQNQGLGETVRRKQRSELVVACPSGAIQIYDIRSARQITSYTSPPGSGFLCNPSSVIFRSSAKGVKRRVTVAALRGTTKKKKGKIVVWEERIGRDVPLKEKIRMFQQEADVEDLVRLDVSLHRGVAGNEEYQVICVGSKGRIAYWDEGLQHEFVGDGSLENCEIRETMLIGLEQAKEGILKNREDVSAIALARGIKEVLVSLTTTQAKLRNDPQTLSIHIHGLRSESTGQELTPNVKEVVSLGCFALPHSPVHASDSSSHHFYSSGALLFSVSPDNLAIFQLSRITPTLQTSLRIPGLSSMTPISENIVAIIDGRSLNVLDTRYNAVLASRLLNVEDGPNGIADGASNAHINEAMDASLMAFFPDTGSVGAIQGNKLVTLQIEGEDVPNHPRKKLKHSTLADAVGRGLGISQGTLDKGSGFDLSSEIGVPETPPALGKSWDDESKQLEHLAEKGDSKAFDKLARSCFDLSSKGQTTIVHPRKLDLVLSLMFAVTEDPADGSKDSTGRKLKVQAWPGKTVEFFSRQRLLSQGNIEAALKRTRKLLVVEHLHPTAVVTAVAHANVKTMKKLKTLLHLATSLDTREVMCAIRLALQRLVQQQNLEQMQLLTAGPAEDGDAMQTDDPPPPHTPKHIPYAHDAIRLSLDRLQTLHPSTFAAAIAAEFSPPELFALIDYLRLALAQRGWFARHEDPVTISSSGSLDIDADDSAMAGASANANTITEPGAPHPGLSSTAPESDRDLLAQSAQLAVALLNAALDTLGTQGWLLADRSNAAAILGHMRAEVAAALEGVEEAAYLHGLLTQMLQFAGSVPQHALHHRTGTGMETGTAPHNRPVLLETMSAAAAAAADGGAVVNEARALPLGLRYVPPGGPAAALDADALVRHKAGGEPAKRSARDVGRLKSMRVGVHSFERIVL